MCVCSMFSIGLIINEVGQIWVNYMRIQVIIMMGMKLRFGTVHVCSMFCTGFISNEMGQTWLYYTRIQVS